MTVGFTAIQARKFGDGTDTGFVTPHVFTEAGTYTVPVGGCDAMDSAEYVWDETSDQTIRFMGVKTYQCGKCG